MRHHRITPPRRWGAAATLATALVLLAADGPAKPSLPSALACDRDGNLFIADARQPTISRRDPRGFLAVVFQRTPKHRTPLNAIRAMTVGGDGDLFVADSATADVYRVRAGEPPAPLTAGALEVPTGLVATPEGDLIVCDLRLGTVSRIPKAGGPPMTLAKVPSPRGVALGPSGALIVLSMGPDQILSVAPDGVVKPLVKGRPFRFPNAILRGQDASGYLVSDGYAATIWMVSDEGDVRPKVQGAPLVRPSGLARDPSGDLLVADPGAGKVFRVSARGEVRPIELAP